jgi:hypothetical protein
MSYTVINFKTKKALKEAVATWNEWDKNKPSPLTLEAVMANKMSNRPATAVRCYQPGLGPSLTNFTGTVYLEGPHFPLPHKWYATAIMKDGVVVSVK